MAGKLEYLEPILERHASCLAVVVVVSKTLQLHPLYQANCNLFYCGSFHFLSGHFLFG